MGNRAKAGSALRLSALVAVATLLTLGMSVSLSAVASAHSAHHGKRSVSAQSAPVLEPTDPGTPYRWGRDSHKDPVTSVPTAVAGVPGTIVQMATSNGATYVLTSAGEVWAWGSNEFGELGDGTMTDSYNTAVEVNFPAGVKIAQLANPLPANSGLVIDSSGNPWGWGADSHSAMCMSGTNLVAPVEIPGLSNVSLATGQGFHSIFDVNGTVVSCGVNDFGELGDGTETRSATPVDVQGLPPGVAVESLEASWHGSGGAHGQRRLLRLGVQQAGPGGRRYHAAECRHCSEGRSRSAGGAGVPRWLRPGRSRTHARALNNGTVWAWGTATMDSWATGRRVIPPCPCKL